MLTMFRVSRPRFWMYLFGPYLLGAASAFHAGTGTFSSSAVLLGLYFTLPANMFIYGINDIYDYETDVTNEKKQGYESVVPHAQHRFIWRAITVTNIVFIPLVFTLHFYAALACLGFVFLGYSYSAPPIRAKARPFLDSASNALYVMPGIAAYFAFGGDHMSIALVLAGICWSAAMHAFSAVPDIDADTLAGIPTIATTLGAQRTLYMCMVLYVIAGGIAGFTLGIIGWIGCGVYVALMLMALRSTTHHDLMKTYKQFPMINTGIGALLFLSIVL